MAEGLQRSHGHSLLCEVILRNNPGNLFPQMPTVLGSHGVDLEIPTWPSPAYPSSLPTDPPASMSPTVHQSRRQHPKCLQSFLRFSMGCAPHLQALPLLSA